LTRGSPRGKAVGSLAAGRIDYQHLLALIPVQDIDLTLTRALRIDQAEGVHLLPFLHPHQDSGKGHYERIANDIDPITPCFEGGYRRNVPIQRGDPRLSALQRLASLK